MLCTRGVVQDAVAGCTTAIPNSSVSLLTQTHSTVESIAHNDGHAGNDGYIGKVLPFCSPQELMQGSIRTAPFGIHMHTISAHRLLLHALQNMSQKSSGYCSLTRQPTTAPLLASYETDARCWRLCSMLLCRTWHG